MELPKPIPGLLARDHPANHAFPIRQRTSGTLRLASPLQSRGGGSFKLPSPVFGHRGLTQDRTRYYRSLPVVTISLFPKISTVPSSGCSQSPNHQRLVGPLLFGGPRLGTAMDHKSMP